ncbi:unnamed protein product [Arctia plantaginis]|uniref:Aquaporin n=1 Tax=Arctia plantaginis TaxID=874455 RepID=A0A8S0YPC0_ARCPL|nr:unnamed protein product [Arctia plantaginis]
MVASGAWGAGGGGGGGGGGGSDVGGAMAAGHARGALALSPVSTVSPSRRVATHARTAVAHTAHEDMARPRNDEGTGVGAWVRRWWRALLAELVSTALLVWLGCATLVPIAGPTSVQLTHPAFAFGFVVVANICAFGAASGAHMNPAVTLAALIYGQLEWLPALTYVIAQLVGAVIGFAGLVATSPADVVFNKTGVTLPGPGVSPLAAVATEAAITGTLVMTVCGIWAAHDPLRPDYSAPLKIGVVIAGLVYVGGPATGASLNPARSFGAALVQNMWECHWVYWVGPLLGGALAALLHRWVLTPSRSSAAAAEPQDAEIPLNDKP